MATNPDLRHFYSKKLSENIDNFIFKDNIQNVEEFLTL